MSSTVFIVRRRDIAWAVVLSLLLTSVWVARGDRAGAGAAPPGDGIAVVYVAVGTNFPDSLGVGPAGGVNGAPVIIVPTDPPIPVSVAAELVRLDPRKVVIIGGTAVVSGDMETALASLLPNATIERIGGANRYETNVLLSQATFPVEAWASVPPSAFTGGVSSNTVVSDLTAAWNETTGQLFAPIHLPHGAEILELKVYAVDNDAVFNMIVKLSRFNAEIAGVQTSGALGDHILSDTTMVAGREIVDNETYPYVIEVSGANGTRFIRRVMVRYQLGAPGG